MSRDSFVKIEKVEISGEAENQIFLAASNAEEEFYTEPSTSQDPKYGKRRRTDDEAEAFDNSCTSPWSEEPDCSSSNLPSTSKKQEKHMTYCNNLLLNSGTFYELYKKQDNGRVLATCLHCNKMIKGNLKVSSNLVAHMRKHKGLYEKFVECRKNKNKDKIQRSKREAEIYNFNLKVIAFIANSFLPFSSVDCAEFRKLFKGTNSEVFDTPALKNLLTKELDEHLKELKIKMAKVKYFCVTADFWSSTERSYFGYAVHWINNDCQRESAVLFCRRISKKLNLQKISIFISKINEKFGLNNENIVCTGIDNGENFFKAFRELGIDSDAIKMDDKKVEAPYDKEVLEDLQFPTIDQNVVQLPNPVRSLSYTLNLIFSSDLKEILEKDEELLRKHLSAIGTCSKLWRESNSFDICDEIEEILGVSLPTLVVTEWTSLFNAIQKLLAHKEKLSDVSKKLKIPQFTSEDLKYLEQFSMFMEPIFDAVNNLKKENYLLHGCVLPSILTLKVKYAKLKNNKNLKLFRRACSDMENVLLKRFDKYFTIAPEVHDAVIAAVTCPGIKGSFLSALQRTAPDFDSEKLMTLLTEAAQPFLDSSDVEVNQKEIAHPGSFFDFGDNPTPKTTIKELQDYMKAPHCSVAKSLDSYPLVKKIFLKYNTPLATSAPVEALFPYASTLESPPSYELSNEDFEKFIMFRNFWQDYDD